MSLRRNLLAYGLIVAAIFVFVAQCKPSEDKLKDTVQEALDDYSATKAAPGAAAGKDRTNQAMRLARSRDWIVARSYSAELNGEAFSCWGAAFVTVCTTPDDKPSPH